MKREINIFKGITYFNRHGFSINEGEGPINIHVSWFQGGYIFYFYLFIWIFRVHFNIDKPGRLK